LHVDNGTYIRLGYYGVMSVMARSKGSNTVSKRHAGEGDGIAGDWGKTRPFWCLSCGRGYRSVERVLAHYSEAAHGNESMSVGVRGLTKKQQIEAFRLRYK
jgi:hypothetical protein